MTDAQPPTDAGFRPSVRLGFIKLVVQDLDAMVAFYETALGLAVSQTIDTESMIEKVLRRPGETTGFSLILYRHKDGRAIVVGNGHGPVGLFVRDPDAAFDHAVKSGAKAHRSPFDTAGGRAAFVLDPEGHELEFISVRGQP